jgi:tRNA (mo5U34)-methyltransferase
MSESVEARVQSRQDWFHTIELPDGTRTPGSVSWEYQQQFLERIQLPERLDGLRVLDIGCYDGFFSFEAERRGADVVAIDVHPVHIRCFELARDLLGSKIPYHQMSVYDLDAKVLGGPFDIVFFFGVFYHLRHPLMSLDNIWNICRDYVLMESHVCDNQFVLDDGSVTTLEEIDPRLVDTPISRYYPHNELNAADYSNWFGFNIKGVLDSLTSSGFKAKHLSTWDGRASFRAEKDPALPRPWERGSYEGTKFEENPDGSWRVIWHEPK